MGDGRASGGPETHPHEGLYLTKVCTFDGRRPIAPIQHRYELRYVVGYVHPAFGRTLWHIATTVCVELFSAGLAAFARQAGAGPDKQIVLVLDRARWHTSPKV